ncbi:hypothetical protein, partial [Myroides odoratimimus]|uniref:hypothetical protein n=1 Tax=Myroides odoratimimus TaxID=76832 RepID=UPI0019646019
HAGHTYKKLIAIRNQLFYFSYFIHLLSSLLLVPSRFLRLSLHISSRKPLSGQANSKKTPRIPEEPQAQTQYSSINQHSIKNSILHYKTKRATKVINSISSQKERKENKKTVLFNNFNLREQPSIQDTNTKKGEYS